MVGGVSVQGRGPAANLYSSSSPRIQNLLVSYTLSHVVSSQGFWYWREPGRSSRATRASLTAGHLHFWIPSQLSKDRRPQPLQMSVTTAFPSVWEFWKWKRVRGHFPEHRGLWQNAEGKDEADVECPLSHSRPGLGFLPVFTSRRALLLGGSLPHSHSELREVIKTECSSHFPSGVRLLAWPERPSSFPIWALLSKAPSRFLTLLFYFGWVFSM